MPNYAFTFKKDDIFVEFLTTDRDSVERQFKIWVENASDYALKNPPKKTTSSKQPKTPTTKEVEASMSNQQIENSEITEANSTAETVPAEPEQEELPVEEDVIASDVDNQQDEPQKEDSLEEPQAEESKEKDVEFTSFKIENTPDITDEATAPAETTEKNDNEVFDKATTLLKTINTIEAEKNEEISDDASPQMPNFEAILEDSLENPTFEPKKSKDEKFLQLINDKDTQNKFNYFIITAYYLLEHEKLERFSLKQINAKLMQNLSTVVDHTVLQDAINTGLVELIPDLTGISGISEYKLTEKGEDYYATKI